MFALQSQALFVTEKANAHPLSQGRMELVIYPAKITLWARVAVEEVIVQQLLPAGDDDKFSTPSEVYRKHGDYILKHVIVSADGTPLTGKVISIQEPDAKSVHPLDMGTEYATYEIDFPLAKPPATVEIRENVLNEVEFTPGNRWEASYITGIRQEQGQGQENLYLSSSTPLKFTCDWSTPVQSAPLKTQEKSPPAQPPKNLTQPLPAVPDSKLKFAAGVAFGICAIYLLAAMLKKLKR